MPARQIRLAAGPLRRPGMCERRGQVVLMGRTLGGGKVIGNLEPNCRELSTRQQYRTLLAVLEAILWHRGLSTRIHDLADRVHCVVRFDSLALVLHDEASSMFGY